MLFIIFRMTRVYSSDRPQLAPDRTCSDGWAAPWPLQPAIRVQARPRRDQGINYLLVWWFFHLRWLTDLTAPSFYCQVQQLESRTFISSTNASSKVTNESSRLLNASVRSGERMFYFIDDLRTWRRFDVIFFWWSNRVYVGCTADVSEISLSRRSNSHWVVNVSLSTEPVQIP